MGLEMKYINRNIVKSPIYNIWACMKNRCLLVFQHFYEDMGEKPELKTLDRINVNGNYEPSNCRWATSKEQANNRRNNIVLTYKGTSLGIAEWSKRLNISFATLSDRIKFGWSTEKALETRPKSNNGEYGANAIRKIDEELKKIYNI